MNNARKDGSLAYSVGRVDPEIEGYSGKTWASRGGNPSLEGAASGGVDGAWGVSASNVGGPREATRGMGNTTTQTERGYDNRTPISGPGDGFSVSQVTPIQHGDLATGGEYSAATFGMDVEIPQVNWKKLGIFGLKAGASKLIPGLGMVTNIGGRIYQRFHKDSDPGTQSAMELMMGYDPRYQGKWFRGGKKTWTPGQQVAQVVDQPIGRGV